MTAPAPVLGEAGHVGQLVGQAGRGDDPSGVDDVPAGELEAEAVVLARDVEDPSGEDLGPVGAYLLARDPQEVRRRPPLVPEVAVHVGGRRIARLAGVDDEHRASLPGQLQGRCEAGGGPADDGDVDVPLDDGVAVVGAVVVGGGVVDGGVRGQCAHDVHGRRA